MKTTYGYAENKEQIAKRLSRAEGQVRGIARMVKEDEYCIDILTQVTAVQAALDKVALELLRDHAKHCMANGDGKQQEEKADELVKAIGRMVGR
ncbi:MAG TPA: metal-sensitive transcriptional regulator [Candidatus Saccharimonadales bacterium]